MSRPSVRRLRLAAAAAFLFPLTASAQGTFACNDLSMQVLKDNSLVEKNVLDIVKSPTCFIEANVQKTDAVQALAPARASLLNAFTGLSGSQQQGSSLSSSGSTNAVSKPSGPTSLIEEFGGVNATAGTSSFTVQWSPGTMFTNLALTGANYLCLSKDEPKGCISASLLENLTPLTVKITANTSSGSSSLAGAATTPSSTSSSQPVSVSSKGASGPGFAGLTAQYSFMGSRSKAGVSSLTSSNSSPNTAATLQYYLSELSTANNLAVNLLQCQAYTDWKAAAKNNFVKSGNVVQAASPTTEQIRQLDEQIEQEYRSLLTSMLGSQSCLSSVKELNVLYAAILEAETYEDFAAVQQSSAMPELALEYDLNTPQNQPSYSSAKISANWQFGKGTPNAPAAPTKANPNPTRTPEQEQIEDYAGNQAAVAASSPGGAGSEQKETAAVAKPVAQANAQPWSLTVTGTADIYNGEPPSSVPSASHLRDIQAGAEISYLFSPSANSSALRSFIGPITAAAAYSYQDQTSPAILTGPALTDFTGLPSSTTSAYAQRGVIHLGQLRLGFGTGSNTTFPLAFTYSNRTELITHPVWGVQFGVTYNMTSLFTSSGTAKASGN